MTKEVLAIFDNVQIAALTRDTRTEPNPSHNGAQALLDHIMSLPGLQPVGVYVHTDNPTEEDIANAEFISAVENKTLSTVRTVLARELGQEVNDQP